MTDAPFSAGPPPPDQKRFDPPLADSPRSNFSNNRFLVGSSHTSPVLYEPSMDQSRAELIATTTFCATPPIANSSLVPPSYLMMDSPPSTTNDSASRAGNDPRLLSCSPTHVETSLFEAPAWCPRNEWDYNLSPSQPPPYSRNIYAYPAELNDLDSVFNCDITDLDNYLNAPSPSPVLATTSEWTTIESSAPSCLPSTLAAPPLAISPVSADTDEAIREFFPALPAPARRRKPSNVSEVTSSSPSSSEASTYRERRDKNNLASQRSRAKRQQLIKEQKEEQEQLKTKNIRLRTTVSALETQVADYKKMLLMIAGKD